MSVVEPLVVPGDDQSWEYESDDSKTARQPRLHTVLVLMSSFLLAACGLGLALFLRYVFFRRGTTPAPLVNLNTPAEYGAALQRVVAGSSCVTRYVVPEYLFGTATSYNRGEENGMTYLDGRGVNFQDGTGCAVAWLSGPSTLSTFLNDAAMGCCSASVTTMSDCFCKVAVDVGLLDIVSGTSYLSRIPLAEYVYVILNAVVANATIASEVPTWDNLLDNFEESFPVVLRGFPPIPTCKVPEDVRRELKGSTYSELFNRYTSEFKGLKCSISGCETMSSGIYSKLGDGICSSPAAVRTYLLRYFDANPIFQGTGVTSGGTLEYIITPNPALADVELPPSNAHVLSFGFPPGDFTCPV